MGEGIHVCIFMGACVYVCLFMIVCAYVCMQFVHACMVVCNGARNFVVSGGAITDWMCGCMYVIILACVDVWMRICMHVCACVYDYMYVFGLCVCVVRGTLAACLTGFACVIVCVDACMAPTALHGCIN